MLFNLCNLIQNYKLNIKGVIQAGAHYGQEIEDFLKNDITNIVCFEPCPEAFEKLKTNSINKALIFNFALGNENKKIFMNIETANEGMSNSILEPKLHLIKYPHIKFESKVEVEMVKLDDFIENNIETKNIEYNFLCLDAQGYELEILKGARKILNKIDYVLCEVNRDETYHQCPHVNEIDDFLIKYNLNRVTTNWEGMIWGDALYSKTL